MLVQNICSKEAYNMLVSNNNTFLVDVMNRRRMETCGCSEFE